ncbi:MAG: ribosome maturation factor RimP [Betaproteobacteria bacterium]|nr:ribosome maturation factor RimP [Betaproteobacteria bacterium]
MDLRALLEPTVNGLGFELVDLEAGRGGRLIRLFIDKPGGIDVEDCARVSHQVTRLLAVEADYDYDRLEVSSPGLDRPLKRAADFVRFAGREAQLKMRVPKEGRRNYVGILRGVDDGVLHLEVDGKVVDLALEQVEKARLVPNI